MPLGKKAKHGHGGHGGHGDMFKYDKNSFVQNQMRRAAMKLHTKDQSKEGEQVCVSRHACDARTQRATFRAEPILLGNKEALLWCVATVICMVLASGKH